jgi:hypothetical protein
MFVVVFFFFFVVGKHLLHSALIAYSAAYVVCCCAGVYVCWPGCDDCVVSVLQGEALRQSLLTRFYGRSQLRNRRDSGSGGSLGGKGGGGAVVLSRTELTLHDVQVMEGWMDGWLDGWVGGWVHGWMDGIN